MTGTETPFFDQIGISKVVWLDDLFDTKVPNAIDIAEQVAAAIAAGSNVQHPKLKDLTVDDSPQEWARQIQKRLEESEIPEFLRQIRPQQATQAPAGAGDYSPGEIEAVVSSLGSTVQRVGLARWPNMKEELIGGAAGGVFLVDRERRTGSEHTNVGDDIVKELITRCADEVLIVVLTHSVPPQGAETLRHTLAAELDVPIARLGVVSKRPAGLSLTDSLTDGVRAAVRVTLTQLTCRVVTARIAAAMRKALAETEAALGDLPVSGLDRAIFENSLTEGASEIDVLSRILLSRQRTAIDAHVAGALDEVHSPLARIRKLRLLEPLPQLPAADASLLTRWRRDEVFDAGETLNALRAPLACGDVFRKNGSQKYFVLLGQPCDLMVRPNGQRAAREAVLVKLAMAYTPTGSEGRFFEVPPLEGAGRWALDFRDWVSVDLECLEWASFNSDGSVAFSPSDHPPSGLLPGWERRFERARNRFQNGREYWLSLGDIPSRVATASATRVEFPYRRAARVRGARALGAYAAFASFQARSAFDHDFAKGIGEESGQTTQSRDHGP